MYNLRDLKAELLAGGNMAGLILTEFRTPSIGPMLAAAGMDFVIIDMEHGVFSYETMADLTISCRGVGITPFVRIPEIRSECFTKCLDAGAMGVLVPGIETAEDVENCRRYALYAPEGERGVSIRKLHSGFTRPDRVAYTKEANRKVLVMGQIETARGVANVDEIARTPGLDLLFIGPSDLAHSLNPEGGSDCDRRLREAIDNIVAAGKRHGKILGTNASNSANATEMLAAGVQFITMGTDVGAFIDACAEKTKVFRGGHSQC